MGQDSPESMTKSIDEWVAFFKCTDIPVLKHTVRDLAHLQEDEDNFYVAE